MSGRINPSDNPLLTAIIVIAILVRAFSFFHMHSLAAGNPLAHPYPVISGDSAAYALSADGILKFHAYQEVEGEVLRNYWPPGYPALLAITKALTGSIAWVVVVQIALTCFALVLLFALSRRLLPHSYWTFVPALAYALDPVAIFTDSAVMTDGLFTALLVCIVFLAFFQSRISGWMRWGLVGILIGVATLIRPIGEFFVLLFPLLILLQYWMDTTALDTTRLKAIGALLLGCALVLLPWMVRNERVLGSFEITNLGGNNLLNYDVAGFLTWRELQHSPHPLAALLVLRHVGDPVYAHEYDAVTKRIATDLAAMTPPGELEDKYQGTLAISYVLHDPLGYAYFDAVNTIPFFLSSSLGTYRQLEAQESSNSQFYAPQMVALGNALSNIRHPESLSAFFSSVFSIAPSVLEILYWACVSILALVALIVRRREFAIVLCAILVLYFAGLTGPMAASRYRLPAEPYLLVLAAVGAHFVRMRLRRRFSSAS